VLAVVTLSATAITCNVFEPPELRDDGGGASAGAGGASGGGGIGASAGTGGSAGSSAHSGSNGDAGPAENWWAHTTADGCLSAGVPKASDRPSASGGTSLPPIQLATSRMRFGSADDDKPLTGNPAAWQEIGFDIDESCTASETCTADGEPIVEHACKNSLLIPFDGKQCRDNQIGNLFPVAALSPIVGPLFGVTEPNWNCALHRGELTLFLKVSDYDGQPNDSSVRVDLYTSTGLQALPNWTCTSGPEGSVAPDWFNQAPWLHIEHWKIAQRSIALNAQNPPPELPDSKYADVAGFVRDGWLFAQFPAATELWLNGERGHVPGFRLQLHRAVMVGKLGKAQNGTWTLTQGTFGAVVLPSEILGSFREIAFCENMCDAYDSVVQYLNTHQDALSGTSEKLPDTPCNALSIGIAFEARQATATAADVEEVDPPVDCPPPKHPLVPQHGCVCPATGGGPCMPPDAGTGDGGN
jgi:hypothetical protein